MLLSTLDSVNLPNLSIRLMLSVLDEEGLDGDEALRSAGLQRKRVEQPNGLVTGRQELQVQRAFAGLTSARPGVQALWIALGQNYRCLISGPMGKAQLTMSSIADAVEYGHKMAALHFSIAGTNLVRDGARIVGLDLLLHDVPDDIKAFTVCRDLAAVTSMMDDLWSGQFPFEAIELGLTGESAPEIHHAAVTPSDRTAWRWSGSASERKLHMANRLLNRVYVEECDTQLGKEELAARVTRAAVARFISEPPGRVSLEGVARDIGLTSRTLQRKLMSGGLTFRNVVSIAQKQAAEDMIQVGHHPLSEIAFRLGYADVSAFSHAFRRWFGVSPGCFRKKDGI